MDLNTVIRSIPDFPEKGIIFRDITPILKSKDALRAAVDRMADQAATMECAYIAGPESRGFIFGVPLAYNMNKGFIPVRKEGKLPYKTNSKSYDLEYGAAVIEVHQDAFDAGDRIIIVDDLLATGGTAKALCELITEMGGVVAGLIFLIELEGLGGRNQLEGYDVRSIMTY